MKEEEEKNLDYDDGEIKYSIKECKLENCNKCKVYVTFRDQDDESKSMWVGDVKLNQYEFSK